MKNFTKILILVALFGFFGAARAEASLSCYVDTSARNTGDVAVLGLSSESNAHAALPTASTYNFSVYCGGVSGLSNSCSDNSEIFAKLSGSTNAHVQERSGAETVYPEDVCLGNSSSKASIEVSYQDDNCNGFDTTVASLTKSPSNAHVGEADSYARKICASMSLPRNSGGGWMPSSTASAIIGTVANSIDNVQNTISEVSESIVSVVKTTAEKIADNTFSNTETFVNEVVPEESVGLASIGGESSSINVVDTEINPESLIALASSGKNSFSVNNIYAVGLTLLSVGVLVFVGRRLFV